MALAAKKFYGRSPDYPLVQTLYRRAFPPRERIPGIALRWMAAHGHLDALAFWEKKKFCGFAYLAVQEKTVFIVYRAVVRLFHVQDNRPAGIQGLDAV